LNDLELALRAASRAPYVPIPCPSESPGLEEAYAIQRNLSACSALPVAAWKLGLTGNGAREAFGADEPTVGRLCSSAISLNWDKVAFVGPKMYAEAELVFELGQDLPVQEEPYTRADLCSALSGVYAGIEIVRSRFATSNRSLPLLIADNSSAHGLVLGEKLSARWDDRFADLHVTLARNAESPVQGSTAHVLDNPLSALVWLANWLRKHENYALKREQLIASGTCTGVTEICAGDTIAARFDGTLAAGVSLRAPIQR
jgi:2-keto-4-pentenoate hydratase